MSITYHLNGVIVDAHNDTMMKVVDSKTLQPVIDIGKDTPFHIDLPKMKRGGVNIAYFAAYTSDTGCLEQNNSQLLASINALQFTEQNNRDSFCIAKSYDQIDVGIKEDKRIGIQTIEGAYAFDAENLMGLMQQYEDLGVKVIAPVWNFSNAIGEGTLNSYFDEKPSQGGLTDLGRIFVQQMNRRGMIIDVSHMNEKTFWDVIEATQKPLIASHSGASAIKNHVRNLTDEQLKAIARLKGVVNVVFCRYFIGDETAGVSELVDHIDHMVKVIGDEHVGLGSDFDGATMPVDLSDISQMGKIGLELQNRGYQETSIRRIMGLNNLRVLKEAERVQNTNLVLSKTLHSDISGEMPVLWIPLTEEEHSLVCAHGTKVSGLIDGYPVVVQVDSEPKQISLTCSRKISEPFHVATLQFTSKENSRYFCTRVVVLK